MSSRLDDLLGGGIGFLNSFELGSALADLRIPAEDRLDTLVDFTTRRGQRFCPLALDLVLGPVFDQDSAEFFEQFFDEFPEPPDLDFDDEGFDIDDEFFLDFDEPFDLAFEGKFNTPGVPSEPFSEFLRRAGLDSASDALTKKVAILKGGSFSLDDAQIFVEELFELQDEIPVQFDERIQEIFDSLGDVSVDDLFVGVAAGFGFFDPPPTLQPGVEFESWLSEQFVPGRIEFWELQQGDFFAR